MLMRGRVGEEQTNNRHAHAQTRYRREGARVGTSGEIKNDRANQEKRREADSDNSKQKRSSSRGTGGQLLYRDGDDTSGGQGSDEGSTGVSDAVE